ncbi:MAG: hypothetical protein K6G08_06235 [Prevotella sp.]|nr:hypothetical protein [Prevotella sp.]
MKKKFINGLLMAAAFVTATGSMVSCTDKEEDRLQEFQQAMAESPITIKVVEDQAKALHEVDSTLRALIANCHTNCKAYVDQQLTKYVTIASFNKYKIDTLVYYTSEKIEELLKGKLDTMQVYTKEEINNLLKGYMPTDSIEKYYFTKNDVNDLLKGYMPSDTITKYFYSKTEVDNLIKEFTKEQDVIRIILGELKNADSAINNAVDSLMDNHKYGTGDEKLTTHELVDSFLNLSKIAIEAHAWAKDAKEWVDANKETFIQYGVDIAALKKADSVLKQNIADINSDIFDLQSELSDLKVHVYNVHCDSIRQLNDSVLAIQKNIEQLDSFARANIDTLTNKISKVEEAYKAADKELKDEIKDIKDEIKDIKDRLEVVEKGVLANSKSIKGIVTEIRIDGCANPIYGEGALPIGIQSNVLAAHYGYIKVPGGVYFPNTSAKDYVSGVTVDAEDLEGVTKSAFATDQLTQLDDDDNAGTIYVTVNPSTIDFAGQTLKLLNSQGQEAGITLGELQKSDHVLAFGYDYTRAGSMNFYEAPAKLVNIETAMPRYDATSLKSAASALKEILTREKPQSDQNNASAIAVAVYKNMSNILDRYALQATYKSYEVVDGEEKEVEHQYTSAYNLAAVAVRALPYNFADEFTFSNVPGIKKLEDFIGDMIDGIKIDLGLNDVKIHDIGTISKITIKEKTKADFAAFNVEVKFTINQDVNISKDELQATVIVPRQAVYPTTKSNPEGLDPSWFDANGRLLPQYRTDNHIIAFVPEQTLTAHADKGVEKNITYSFTYEKDLSEDILGLYNDMTEPLDNINDMIDKINTWLDDVNDLLKAVQAIEGKIEEAKNDVKKDLLGYLDKFNEKFTPYLNGRIYLEPKVFVKADDSFRPLSQSAKLATKVTDAEFNLVTTSYTAEILAPAYKKFARVTNVWNSDRTKSAKGGDANLKAIQAAANTFQEGVCTFNKVLPGNTNLIHFVGQAGKGYIYEILFEAMDYEGHIIAQKYYVQVK